MKKTIMTLLAGALIGAAVAVATPAYGAAQQYVLTLFDKPVLVNGVKYTDPENPILNYNGKTYIPLASVAKLTGVPAKWNAEKKRVEIGKTPGAPASGTGSTSNSGDTPMGSPSTSCEIAGMNGCTLNPDTVIVETPPATYKGLSDEDDAQYAIAVIMGKALPPRISEGWINNDTILKTNGVEASISGTTISFWSAKSITSPLLRITVEGGWVDKKSGETTAGGIRIKKYEGINYFSIVDLQAAGVID